MHCIKRDCKAQILGQAELYIAENNRTSSAPLRRVHQDELRCREHLQITLQETRQEAYGIEYSTEPETRNNKEIQHSLVVTAPLQRGNMSCLQARCRITTQSIPLHWCRDKRPCSGTALYTEWTSIQLPVQSQHSVDPSHPPEKMHNMPYITFP